MFGVADVPAFAVRTGVGAQAGDVQSLQVSDRTVLVGVLDLADAGVRACELFPGAAFGAGLAAGVATLFLGQTIGKGHGIA